MMLAATQATYESDSEYGLTDNDMKKAIQAALDTAGTKNWKQK